VTRTVPDLRRLGLLAAVALIVESALYSAVAPLLPHYRDELGLSKPAAGVLTGAYTAGMLIGSLAGAYAAGRLGPRRTVVCGFTLLGGASIVFGLAGDIVVLDTSRAAQGFGAGLIWSGVLAWLIAAVPDDRRGQAIGGALGAAIFGTLFGPVLGTVAVTIGPAAAFGAIAALSAVVVVWVLRTPAPARPPDLSSDWGSALRSRLLLAITALSILPGVILGGLNALVPLRMDAEGLSEPVIGATFLVGALVAAATAPVVGRRSDRAGRVPLVVAGLTVAAPLLVVLGLVTGGWAVAVLTVATFGLGVTLFSVPLMALLSEVSEDVGLTAGPTAALLNLTFAGGETLGAPLSALGAEATSDGAPFVVLGAVVLAAVLLAATRLREPRAAVAAGRA
jgi:predicted MFS family arabinose efflux permease